MSIAVALLLGAVLVFLTVWFAGHIVSSRGTESGGAPIVCGGVGPIIVVSWLYGILPAFITITTQGRSKTVVGDAVPFSGLANGLSTVLWVALLAYCTAAILSRLRAKVQVAPLAVVAAFMSPWLATVLSLLLSSGVPDKHYVDYPLVVMALWLARPPIEQCLRLLGVLTVLTASLSLVMGLIKSSNGLMPDLGAIGVTTPAEGKAILPGPLLAGPFGHSNTLGITLALALPTVLALQKPQYKWLGATVVLTALIWSASRTSLLAASIVLLVPCVLSKANVRHRTALVAAATLAFALVWIPFNTVSWTAFSDRGQIWVVSLSYWRSTPLFGQGPNFYDKMSLFDNALGPYAFYGHNMMVDTLTRLGVVGLTTIGIMLVTVAVRAHRAAAEGFYSPEAIVLAYLACGLFEVPVTSFASFSAKGWMALLPFLLIAFGYTGQRPKTPQIDVNAVFKVWDSPPHDRSAQPSTVVENLVSQHGERA